VKVFADRTGSRRLGLIAQMLEVAKQIDGRTKFQKMAYFVNLYNWNCITDFKFHYYGPFSRELNDDLERMRGNGWIEEKGEMTNAGNTIYKYKIPYARMNLANALISRVEDPGLVKKSVPLIKQLDEFSSDELEIMSSLIYLRRSNPKATKQDLVKMTSELKPRFDISDIQNAAAKLKEFERFGFYL
jgi:uncharacterized protein YwgA